jgi:hypothetical protein
MQWEIVDHTIITCPICGFREELVIPADYCLFFHTCANCKMQLKPEAGDCCVFCSYGDAPCIPKQVERQATADEEVEK